MRLIFYRILHVLDDALLTNHITAAIIQRDLLSLGNVLGTNVTNVAFIEDEECLIPFVNQRKHLKFLIHGFSFLMPQMHLEG